MKIKKLPSYTGMSNIKEQQFQVDDNGDIIIRYLDKIIRLSSVFIENIHIDASIDQQHFHSQPILTSPTKDIHIEIAAPYFTIINDVVDDVPDFRKDIWSDVFTN